MRIKWRMKIFYSIPEIQKVKFDVHLLHLEEHWNDNLKNILANAVDADPFGTDKPILVAI